MPALLIVSQQQVAAEKQSDVWQLLDSPTDQSLRGLSVVNEDIAFASGAGGTIIRTSDAGQSWQKLTSPGGRELELRDLHAFDGKHLIAMNSGQPAKFYTSSDGGIGWQETFHETNPKAFFDAFSFWDNQHGIGFQRPSTRSPATSPHQ